MTFNATFLYSLDALSGAYNACVSGVTSLLFGSKATYPVHPKVRSAVLVTGASSGIGLSLIQSLVSQGVTVFAGLKTLSDAPKVLACLSPSDAHLLIPIHLNVTSQTTLESAHKTLKLRLLGNPLIGIVHCAGSTAIGPLECLSKEDLQRVFDVNALGPILVTQVFMDLLRESQGRVVLMSSISGWMSAPLNAAFASSKMVRFVLLERVCVCVQ
jgi:NAD(P)-dependent dehydrogenase (short-subunit alcohol dehydrogenase family)